MLKNVGKKTNPQMKLTKATQKKEEKPEKNLIKKS